MLYNSNYYITSMNKKPLNGPSSFPRKPGAFRGKTTSRSGDVTSRPSHFSSRDSVKLSYPRRNSPSPSPSRTPYEGTRTTPKVRSSHREEASVSSRLPKEFQSKNRALKDVSTSTSWGSVATWYNDHLEKAGDTYHEKVIYPNLLRIIGDEKGQLKSKKILDLACGQGQFSQLMRDKGAHVTGIDLGKELIAIAESHNVSIKEAGTHKATYIQGSADNLHMLKDSSFDIVVCILALQNIENLEKTIKEANRVLTPSGTFVFVLNHPSFRNPRQSYWGYDEERGVQFRRVDEYMSESHYKIDMTPGSKTDKKFTVTFHRPLQVFIKALSKSGFVLNRLEEWVSHKESEKGPRQKAENKSRKEIPLFMCIQAQRVDNSV